MAANTAPLDCTGCGGKHWTVREVHACVQFGPVANFKAVEKITERQLWYITSILKGDETYAKTLSKQAASEYIKQLKAGQPVAASTVHVPEPPRDPWTLRTPRAMAETIRDGRYAVQPDTLTPLTFVRVTRPKHGKKRGYTVFQTQHSDWYKDCVLIDPTGKVRIIDNRIDHSLLLIVADPITAAMRYGTELGVCCSCARELTDERSRWYGIGPECEKRFPEIITRTDDSPRGPYRG